MLWALLLSAGLPLAHGQEAAGFDFQEDLCPTQATEAYDVYRGTGEGGSPEEARQAARADAQRQARLALCGGFGTDSSRCHHYASDKYIPWKAGEVRERNSRPPTATRYEACASWAVFRRDKDNFESLLQAHDEPLNQLAEKVAEALGEGPVFLDGTYLTSNDCRIGGYGDHARLVFASRLGSNLVDHLAPNTAQVRLEVAFTKDRATLAASVRKSGEQGWQTFSDRNFYTEDFGEAYDCFGSKQAKLPSGGRVGRDGLTASVTISPEKTTFCHGEEAVISLNVSQRSRLRIFSMDQTGKAFQVFPSQGEGDEVGAGSAMELPATMFHFDNVESERLVVAAIAPDQNWGAQASQVACRIPGVFSGGILPATAAIGMATYVVENDPSVCEVSPSAIEAGSQMKEIFDGLEDCW